MTAETNGFRLPLMVKGDIDGFIGLFIDNLVNLLLISGLCLSIGMGADLVFGRILPGTALSVLAGNIFYSWQARRLARREGRDDVTALPYGINTVSLFAYFSFIIAPVYIQTKDASLAWKVGVAACLVSGVFEGLGAFVGERIRRITPRAALLSTLSGIAIAFIALNHVFPLWEKPLIAFVPLAFILIEYFSRARLPLGIPAGLYALVFGGAIAWGMGAMDAGALGRSLEGLSLYLPAPAILEMAGGLADILPYLGIAIPMGILSFFGTLQNIESAAAAGDEFPAMPALAMNGVGTIVGALFGSPFPTTVYIGHPGWKALGARSAYSVINGAVMTVLCTSGLIGVIGSLVPLEAGYPILLWIGVVITAQAFQSTPREHAPAVALGLLPAIASWGLSLLRQYAGAGGAAEVDRLIASTLPNLKGIISFAEGPLLSAMFLTALGVYLIERDFLKAFWWTIALAVSAWFGLIHSPAVGFGAAEGVAAGYTLIAAVVLVTHVYRSRFGGKE